MPNPQLIKEGFHNPRSPLDMACGSNTDPDYETTARLEMKLCIKRQNTEYLTGIDIETISHQIDGRFWHEAILVLNTLKHWHEIAREGQVLVNNMIRWPEIYFLSRRFFNICRFGRSVAHYSLSFIAVALPVDFTKHDVQGTDDGNQVRKHRALCHLFYGPQIDE